MSSLKLTGVNKTFPSGERALFDINLETADKEFIVIAGGENSGKSTLLRVIAGLEEVSSGSVFIDGKDVTETEPKDRDIAMVFKSSTLYPALNVFDNMAFGLRLRKAPEALVQERVKVAANVLGLNEVLYRKPKVLTSAAKQRVAIGRAMVREPKLYLFDEPLSGLDEKLRLDMLNIIINLQARLEGTFIYTTKNLSEALTIGTRIVVMKNGFIQQIDTPANLYDYPANTYVAFFIGSPTVNFIKKAKIVSADGGYKAVFAGGEFTLPENIVKRFVNVADYADKDIYVTLGLRPEDCKVKAGGVLKGKVTGVEGEEEKYAEIEITPDICLNVSCGDGLSKGEEAEVEADLSRLYIFDAKTCLTLLVKDGGYNDTGLAGSDFAPLPYDEEEEIYENSKPKKAQKKKK
ncbi:MAG: ABC transporter ATP-binding protein [Clostridia bacterium]|nr:ABC transporter ATP-binding protein [Clostridia bacterium]